MSFRVWFLRMVWIVAAAVALSGCDDEKKDDENGDGTDPSGDAPALTVAVSPESAAVDGDGKHKVTVTITSDDDAHKSADVTLAVACTGDVKVTIDESKMKAAEGKAEWTDLSVKTDAATVCTYTATATLDEERTGTGTFEVKEAAPGGGGTAPTIAFAEGYPKSVTGGVEVHLSYANVNDINTVEIYVACGVTAPDAVATKDAGNKITCTDNKDTNDVYECSATGLTASEKCRIVVSHGDLTTDLEGEADAG